MTEPDREHRAEALLRCGHLAYWATNFDRGSVVLKQARSLLHALGDALGEGRTLRRLGAIATARDDLDEGGRLIAESLACFEQAEAESEIGTTLLHLGSLLADQGLVDQALPVIERALLIARSGRDPLAVGHALAAMTLVYWKAGDMRRAIDSGEQALALFDRLGQHAAGGTVAYRLSGHRAASVMSAMRADVPRSASKREYAQGLEPPLRSDTCISRGSISMLPNFRWPANICLLRWTRSIQKPIAGCLSSCSRRSHDSGARCP